MALTQRAAAHRRPEARQEAHRGLGGDTTRIANRRPRSARAPVTRPVPGRPGDHRPGGRSNGAPAARAAPGRDRPGAATTLRPGPRPAGRAARPWWPRPPGGGPGHLGPTAFSLDQGELDGHLLVRLGRPRDLGLGQLQLVVSFPGRNARLGRGQRIEARRARQRLPGSNSTASDPTRPCPGTDHARCTLASPTRQPPTFPNPKPCHQLDTGHLTPSNCYRGSDRNVDKQLPHRRGRRHPYG
jgi:hypothetical protein